MEALFPVSNVHNLIIYRSSSATALVQSHTLQQILQHPQSLPHKSLHNYLACELRPCLLGTLPQLAPLSSMRQHSLAFQLHNLHFQELPQGSFEYYAQGIFQQQPKQQQHVNCSAMNSRASGNTK